MHLSSIKFKVKVKKKQPKTVLMLVINDVTSVVITVSVLQLRKSYKFQPVAKLQESAYEMTLVNHFALFSFSVRSELFMCNANK